MPTDNLRVFKTKNLKILDFTYNTLVTNVRPSLLGKSLVVLQFFEKYEVIPSLTLVLLSCTDNRQVLSKKIMFNIDMSTTALVS